MTAEERKLIKANASLALTHPDGKAIRKALELEISEWLESSVGQQAPEVDRAHGAIMKVRAFLAELEHFRQKNQERPSRTGGYTT